MQVVRRLRIVVVVHHLQVQHTECHLKLDGKLHIAEEEVKSHAGSVAEVYLVEANDGLVVVILVLEKGGNTSASFLVRPLPSPAGMPQMDTRKVKVLS